MACTRWLRAVLGLCLLTLGTTPAAAGESTPTFSFHLNEDALAMWQLRLQPTQPTSAKAFRDTDYPHYRSWRWQAGSPDADGWYRLPGLLIEREGRQVRLDPLLVRLEADGAALLIADAEQRPWLIADMAHRMPGPLLDWRHLSLRPLPALAKALGVPRLQLGALGAVAVRGGPALEAKGNINCRNTVLWPGPGAAADVALTEMNAIIARSSRDCSSGSCLNPSPAASTTGEVVIAPDALLANVGDRDVPWFPKFFPDSAPYGNDQHPYLVWALYREDADGALVPLGASGVKHAFFAQNSGCTCSGDYVLYRGCGDLYSAATNDMSSVLGPREEIDPFSGRWGRCGSVFDPDCDGAQDLSGYAQPFERRLLAAEADLLPALHPGARWFIEAWYVVRDDGNLDNSMGYREVLPNKGGTAWSFPTVGPLQSGPVASRWVDPANPTALSQARRLSLSNGRIQLAVRVTDLGGGRWRYRYALMNLDYADSRFSGTGSALRMESTRGVHGIRWVLDRSQVDNLVFRDGDRLPASDWSAPASGVLQLSAPSGRDLGWGRMATISFDSEQPPELDDIALSLGEAESAVLQLPAPRPAERLFRGGFESP